MKKFFKILMITIAATGSLFVLLALIAGFFFGDRIESELQQARSKSEQTEAKIALQMVHVEISMCWAETGSYLECDLSKMQQLANPKYLVGFISSAGKESERLWVGNLDKDLIAKAKEICPDCIVSKESFKAIALAKNSGGELDAWTYTKGDASPLPMTRP